VNDATNQAAHVSKTKGDERRSRRTKRSVECWLRGVKNHLFESLMHLDDSSFGRDIAKVKEYFGRRW